MKACYIWSDELMHHTNRLPAVIGRASKVHSLIHGYGLISHLKVVKSAPASYNELKEFHSECYINHLQTLTEVDEEEYMATPQDEEYGIGYDCAPVSDMFELVSTIAGGTVTAAKCLLQGESDVAINWCGGWHHAHKSSAEGFCYINDIVIGIEKLRKKFPKVLYVDLDVHHGNGVQDAYNLSDSVFTLSFHKFEPGFYPGTGGIVDIGRLNGKGYSCNFPLHGGYTDDTITYAFEKVFNSVFEHFAPDAIVVQCGADALAHDRVGSCRLSIRGYQDCVATVLGKRKPSILLGGGGYVAKNAARLWASLTALTAGVQLDENIPEHQYWPLYGPDYALSIQPSLAKDTNTRSYLDQCIATIQSNLEKYLPLSTRCKEQKTEFSKTKQTDVYEFLE